MLTVVFWLMLGCTALWCLLAVPLWRHARGRSVPAAKVLTYSTAATVLPLILLVLWLWPAAETRGVPTHADIQAVLRESIQANDEAVARNVRLVSEIKAGMENQ